jgi:hypothetical protein
LAIQYLPSINLEVGEAESLDITALNGHVVPAHMRWINDEMIGGRRN